MMQTSEYDLVEKPLIDQLVGLGWSHLAGDTDVPYLTERETFREVLLQQRLREALRRINRDDRGREWLDDDRINQAAGALERLGAVKLMEANQAATELLLAGVAVEGLTGWDGGRDQTIRFIDFNHIDHNDFLVINQFRVDESGGRSYVVPDAVLFVNGIPLVVIECKSPYVTKPVEEAITQLLRYSNQRDWVDQDEGNERLFHYNQLLVATSSDESRTATVGASYEHFLEWKDTWPLAPKDVAKQLGVKKLKSQHFMVAGMLRPEALLDLVRNFIVYKAEAGKTVKIAGRYQQYRAVGKAIERLRVGKTRRQDGEHDRRGGIVWHTQGSGKSLTMVFLVRKMRTLPDLRRFKVVIVTDRRDLQRQLKGTAALTDEPVRVAKSVAGARKLLTQPGADLVFVMIQKYMMQDEAVAEAAPEFPMLNEDENILVLVDEGHRSHSSGMHANLLRGLPNCARIAFTGTPILMGDRKKTHEIFGEFIDRYTIRQSELDGSTVPILYEGRQAHAEVDDGRRLDQLFEDGFAEKTPKERAEIQKRFATAARVLEGKRLVAAKARDIIRHYVGTSLPEGFKAQVVAASRRAAVRYRMYLTEAKDKLIARLERLDPKLIALSEDKLEKRDAETQFLVRAHAHLDVLRRLEVAAVISGRMNDEPELAAWSDQNLIESNIDRFKLPLVHNDPTKADGLAILCVKSMLLTGFDAPLEQAMYLDRPMWGHELLQAIARVNRTATGKSHGLVVDYVGVARRLHEALAVYAAEDDAIKGALASIQDELPTLRDRHRRVVVIFHDRGLELTNVEACVELLADVRLRAEFIALLRKFLDSMGIVLPRPEALPYLRDMKRLGLIRLAAANRYRDEELNIAGAAHRVRELIDRHVQAQGIDPKVPPTSITDSDFDTEVAKLTGPRAKASEMEHAIRHHIAVHLGEDPVRYTKLSERLDKILKAFKDRWDDLLSHLAELTVEARQGRQADESGLDPEKELPFRDVLIEAGCSAKTADRLTALTRGLVSLIRREIATVDFWRNAHAQDVLRSRLVKALDDADALPFERQQAAADRLLDLARHLHVRLTAI